VLVVHATRSLRERVSATEASPSDASTTTLGPWYATLLRWRSPTVLLVNQTTLLPLVLRLAPAATLLERIPDATAELLASHRLPEPFIEAEHAAMAPTRLAPTANRSVVGILNEFSRLIDIYRVDGDGLLEMSLQLAKTPLGPLYKRHISPDRELAAFVAERHLPDTRHDRTHHGAK
jgi:hypothetical protein